MIIGKNNYYPTLKKVFAFDFHQCDKCENYFKFEWIWKAKESDKENNLVDTFLCVGCADTRKKAIKHFIDKLNKD